MYAPRPGLAYCAIDENVVFLDIRRDRYLGLSPASSQAFLALRETALAGIDVDVEGAARSLIEKGIVIAGGEEKAWIASSATAPLREWRGDLDATRPAYVALAWACIVATLFRLRTRSFEHVLSMTRGESIVEGTDLPERAIASFLTALRYFPRRLDCLPASLSLRCYLEALSIPSELVLAVSLGPFAAHCWVELGGLLVNDSLERIQEYTPIWRQP